MVSTRSASSTTTPSTAMDSTETTTLSPRSRRGANGSSKASSSSSSSTTASASRPWSHTPSKFTVGWMIFSLPLIAWDTVYVLGRPYTMEGGFLYEPLYTPYKLYGEIDHVYGWKAFNAHSGFTSAQGFMNIVESVMYLIYLYLFFTKAVSTKQADGSVKKVVPGETAALALLIGFSAAVMTLSKTILYALNEHFSGYDGVGHNPLYRLVFLYMVPNGSWIVASIIMTYTMGSEIIQGLAMAAHTKVE